MDHAKATFLRVTCGCPSVCHCDSKSLNAVVSHSGYWVGLKNRCESSREGSNPSTTSDLTSFGSTLDWVDFADHESLHRGSSKFGRISKAALTTIRARVSTFAGRVRGMRSSSEGAQCPRLERSITPILQATLISASDPRVPRALGTNDVSTPSANGGSNPGRMPSYAITDTSAKNS
ncbi:hypothetical protein SAICODRAFT_175675 [Saitoella complicata NRRL Y-17804]|uniref:Uncharacterized protein n=1 Tax=Saitoella complicata (strain BCRC 22490 / CBS 7301 / JCM 7358 / NBRC 10748 / NRRL Y-17804) TaxID=698492 RepID=A0A0E9NQN9_SAICN|nr:uncharacterized protein SAICODRAFT_175675 [Saitoella complicata NRRL Y-17804]ODQ50323.1 hypothetical protein SAICODRAFT_175675 [Saitoella complicata NRRL Y-17804]GAO52113.1 hypothetical protein G7K_6199-t1 [Saitoella complicata NRRL Y-17804]